MRILLEMDVTMLEAALRLARDHYAELAKGAGNLLAGRLAEQFKQQADHAELLRQAFEDYPTVTLSVED